MHLHAGTAPDDLRRQDLRHGHQQLRHRGQLRYLSYQLRMRKRCVRRQVPEAIFPGLLLTHDWQGVQVLSYQ